MLEALLRQQIASCKERGERLLEISARAAHTQNAVVRLSLDDRFAVVIRDVECKNPGIVTRVAQRDERNARDFIAVRTPHRVVQRQLGFIASPNFFEIFRWIGVDATSLVVEYRHRTSREWAIDSVNVAHEIVIAEASALQELYLNDLHRRARCLEDEPANV
ncbi:MAG TPA: hypothetical protein VGZ01_03415, partial [Trinickia sp.]|nr:hypothetical protein [Trinickia sp.]